MATTYEQQAKPANDAYTGMLAISFFALLIGCAALYLDYAQYPDKPPAKVDTSFRERTSQPDWTPGAGAEKKPGEQPPLEPGKDQAGKDDPDKKGGFRF